MRKCIMMSILFFCMTGAKVFAYDIEVKNADDVTIYYNYINDGTELEVTYKHKVNNGYSGVVVIPEDVTYMNRKRRVTRIGEYAFRNCYRLYSITIPNSVTAIGLGAFDVCQSLRAVHISDLSAWCEMEFSFGSNPLSNAHHLFLNEEEIVNLVIPDGVTTIKEDAFYGCSSLTSITIPNSVASIGDNAFRGCI